jgi:hypothetical protein
MATEAEKVKMYREKAKDTSIPQEVRNTYLDRANELERKAFEATKGTPPAKLAKGGMAKKAMAKGGAVVAKAPAKGAKPVVAIMVGMAKPKGKTMMNKGGMAKKGKC